MRPSPVLVLGSYKERKLNDALADAGFTPVVRRDMDAALHKIRHEDFAGIVVEREWVDVDALEFVLNVRDYEQATRIIVVGNSGETNTDRTLDQMARTFNVGRVHDAEHLKDEIQNILEPQAESSGGKA
jgi:DNA-binding response OmpR family regulator